MDNQKITVMEMSEPAGMRRLSESERDPVRASTFGVGEMILDAVKQSAREIIIGLGGSGTNDGGFGMARAIGFRFNYEEEEEEEVSRLVHLPKVIRQKNLSLPNIVDAAMVLHH